MKVLIGCEFSGVVRSAFREWGHDAWSCDLLPAEDDGPHIQGDVLDHLDEGWDLAIFHPDCTYLANSGVKWLYADGRKENGPDPGRWEKMQEAADFYNRLGHAPVARIARENPIMHCYARALCGSPDQYIQPWQFGHGEVKATGLKLTNLPRLVSTLVVEGREPRVHFASPGPDRWKERSRTLPGIAAAMAAQWG